MTQQTHAQYQQNNLAVTSLVLGIVSVTGFGILTGVPAIITGVIGLKNPVNKGMSWAGIIMGSIATVLTVLFLILFMFLFILAASSEEGRSDSDLFDRDSQYSNPEIDQRRT